LSLSENCSGKAIIPPLASVYGIGALIYVITMIAQTQVGDLTSDNGPIQVANVTFLMVVFLSVVYRTWSAGPGQRTNLGLITYGMMFYVAREGDLHQIDYYPEHLANRRFYQSAEIPVLDKVLVGLLLLTLVIAIIWLLVRVMPSFLKAIRGCEDWAIYILFWIGTIILTQIADHSFLNGTFYGKALEEVGELTAAGIAFLIVWKFPAGSDPSPET
jgi:hypothetical protein